MSEPTFAPPLIMTRTLLLATALGSACYAVATWSGRPTFEPLLLSLLAGIILRSLLGDRFATPQEAVRVSHWLLFPGIVCYALANLNLATIAELPPRALILLCTSLVVAFAVIFLLGRRCGQRLEITSLVATGSAICGASAIVVTAPAVRARAEDVSISLLAVTLAGLLGLFVLLPFCGALLHLPLGELGLMSGALLQHTGFVKEAMAHLRYLDPLAASGEALRFALLVKVTRYLGLIVCIPLVASLAHGRLSLPPALWLYLGAGLWGTLLQGAAPRAFAGHVLPLAQLTYQLLWSVALAAIGLSADVRDLLSANGFRAFWMALGGFCAALAAFLMLRSLLSAGGVA